MFGERIKELRKKNGYTQVSLANRLEVSKGTIAMWEMNKRKPGFEMLCTLSELFDVRIDYLLGKSGDDSSVKLSEEQILQLATWSTEENMQEVFGAYVKLDDYGKTNVENLIRSETDRCINQNTLSNGSNIKITVMIKK